MVWRGQRSRVRRRCGYTAKLNFSFEILYNTQPLSYMLTLTGSRGSSSLLTFWSFRVSASMSQSTDPEEVNNENRRFANRFSCVYSHKTRLIQEHCMSLTTIVCRVVEGKGKTSVKCVVVNIVVVVV